MSESRDATEDEKTAELERFRALAEQARDAITEITPDARFLYVSPSFTELFGYLPDEVLGKSALELIHPDDVQQVDSIRSEAMEEERPAQLVFRFRHKNGSWRWIEMSGRPFRTRDGELRAALVNRDVTERVETEQALQQQLALETRVTELSRHFLDIRHDDVEPGFVRALQIASEIADADRGQVLYVDANGKRIGGHFQWCGEGVPRNDLDALDAALGHYVWSARQLQAGEILHVPRPAELPDEAAPERESMLGQGIRSYLGLPIRYRGLTLGFLDFFRMREEAAWTEPEITRLRLVTELFATAVRRIQTEQARAASDQRFRAMADHVRDSICEFSDDGRILYTNASFKRLTGIPTDALAKIDPLSLIHPDDVEQVRARERSWRAGIPAGDTLRYRIRNPDGSWRWLESTASGYRTGSNEGRVACVIRDVTDREQRSAELERQLEVEQRIAEITRSFIALSPDDLDAGVQSGLEAAAAIAGADRAYLVAGSGRGEDTARHFDWRAPGVEPRPYPQGPPDPAGHLYATERLLRGETVRVPRVRELPDEAARMRESLEESGVHGFLAIPVLVDSRLVGVLGFHCMSREAEWSSHEVNMLRLFAELFAGAVRRVSAEAELRESEMRFRTLAEHARDPICEIDGQGQIRYASPSFCDLTGLDRRGIVGRDFASLIHDDDLAGIYRRCGPQLNTERSGPILYRSRHSNGSWRHVEATARVFTDADGERRTVAVLRDVTERQRSQRSLERQLELETRIADLSQRFLAVSTDEIDGAIRNSLRDLAAVAESDRTWLYHIEPNGPEVLGAFEWHTDGVSPNGGSLEGLQVHSYPWAARQMARGDVVHIPNPEDLPSAARGEREHLERIGVRSFLGIPLHSGVRLVGFLGFETTRNRKLWSVETITLLRIVGDIFVGALGRKLSEQQLRQSQRQLLQAQKMEAVGTLAGGIAHDFNNQLTVMLGNARFLHGQVEGEELVDALSDLERAAEHCAQLTRSLLAFSRRGSVSPRTLDVSEVVLEVEELLRPLIPSSIDFKVQPPQGIDNVFADPTQLQQVLVNLAVNARDAMPAGGELAITIENRRLDAEGARRAGAPGPGAFVEICVIDSGVGIDDDTRARIFEPFFTTKPLGEGTGLGLATAYGIVQESGGAIEVESIPGRGTIFRVLLPRSNAPIDEPESTPTVRSERVSGTVLCVEDDGAVRRVVRRALESAGYSVLEAADGQEALDRVAAHGEPIDAVVTDLDMPRMDGVELAARVSAAYPGTPVIFASAYSRQLEDDALARVPSARFLQKPFGDQTLLMTLRELIERDRDER
jgi:PAS domain S-box-containing protein